MVNFCNRIFAVICRKKALQTESNENSPLKRCLNLFDLTFLAVGSMIGSGIYVFAGAAIQALAGPAILLSFLLAGVASFISALCYAEFGARVPRAGSTYDFAYVTLGEFWAALVGWYLVTGPVFYTATEAKAWSGYFDSLFNGYIANRTMDGIGWWFDTPYLSRYPDFFAAGLVIIVCIIVATGAKLSTQFNNAVVILNLCVILFIICYGMSLAEPKNWTGGKGFMPYGFEGVLGAASACFFAYGGFEAATTAGEEARNPRRTVALAIFIAFVVAACAYILMSTSLTLMIPYHEVAERSAFSMAFEQRGFTWAKYVVAIGALSAMTTTLFSSVFGITRFIYAVASDGLIFSCLAKVNRVSRVPVRSIGIYAVVAVIITLLFDLMSLVEFLTMGFLLCYTLVAASIIILRYRPAVGDAAIRAGRLRECFEKLSLERWVRPLAPGDAVLAAVVLEILIILLSETVCIYGINWAARNALFYAGVSIFVGLAGAIVILLQIFIMAFVQNADDHLWFRVPLVPILPTISISINLLMMLYLPPMTWIRFGVYLLIGLVVYIAYGVRHSIHRPNLQQTHPTISTPAEKRGDLQTEF